jgi:hypothetical protein
VPRSLASVTVAVIAFLGWTATAAAGEPLRVPLGSSASYSTLHADAQWRLDVLPGDEYGVTLQNVAPAAVQLCILDSYWWPLAPASAACSGGVSEVAPGASATLRLIPLSAGAFQIVVRGASCAPAIACGDSLSYMLRVVRAVDSAERGAIVAVGDSFIAGAPIPAGGRTCAHAARAWILRIASVSVACAGTRTADLIDSRSLQVASLRRLQARRAIGAVLVGIGGDDADVGKIREACSADRSRAATACATAIDAAIRRVDDARSSVGRALRAIHRVAPHARLFSIGYPPLWSTVYPIGCGDAIEGALGRLSTALDRLQAAAHQAGAAEITFDRRADAAPCDGRASLSTGFSAQAAEGPAGAGGWLFSDAENRLLELALRQQMRLAITPWQGAQAPDGLSSIALWRTFPGFPETWIAATTDRAQGTNASRLAVTINVSNPTPCNTAMMTTSNVAGEQTLTVPPNDPCDLSGARLALRVVASRESFAATLIAADGQVLLDTTLSPFQRLVV